MSKFAEFTRKALTGTPYPWLINCDHVTSARPHPKAGSMLAVLHFENDVHVVESYAEVRLALVGEQS